MVAGGIGAAIVQRFAAEGAAVTFTYASSQKAAETLASETGATARAVDSADRDAVISFARACGPLDVLVVNAGIVCSGTRSAIIPTRWIGSSVSISIRHITQRSRRRAKCRTAAESSSWVHRVVTACRSRA